MTKRLGNWGEAIASRYLEDRGFVVLARNYSSRFGELDIVAKKDGRLVAVEVKTRTSDRFGSGAEAVTPIKLQRIQTTLLQFLEENGMDGEVGVMVLTIDGSGQVEPIDEIWLS